MDYPVLPSIHLNGTGRNTLLKEYKEAYDKLVDFKEAFRSITFNGRDYYVQGNTAFSKARTDRDIMEHKIGSLMQYLKAHLIHLGE